MRISRRAALRGLGGTLVALPALEVMMGNHATAQEAPRRYLVSFCGASIGRHTSSTAHGDLTPLISRYFDTAVGSKIAASSYERIAAVLGRQPAEVLFVSDVAAELLAAAEAGCQTLLSVRPGNPPQPDANRFVAVRSFDEIE